MTNSEFSHIAVIGAGTMGSGIAAQIANAGLPVLLLDLPAKDASMPSPAEAAIQRLISSEPPQLMGRDNAKLITAGTIDGDFHHLSSCDLIIEAVIEQLPVKQALYRRLDKTVSADCVITSNTSTIPISLLVDGMPASFAKRFAITHYFNPVRFMRLLELVRGANTDAGIMDRLARFNDETLGKGVVRCGDTPGFLGNRIGVYALQVGMHEALNSAIPIEEADALVGRPMGIPKTGIFGLYDLIGVDLMSDVVTSLRTILPDGDDFHSVGSDHQRVTQMIADGYTGNKGKGGFYRRGTVGREVQDSLMDANQLVWRAVKPSLPEAAQRSAEADARNEDPLGPVLDDTSMGGQYAKRVLVRILSYAASLVPDITASPQDIDDAMKLGFNWQRGPFEMIDAIGSERFAALCDECGLAVPAIIADGSPTYSISQQRLLVRHAGGARHPINLPDGVMRFSLTRQTLTPILTNNAASLFALAGDLRLVEFHSKANALTDESMQIVAAAAKDHGAGIIIHNDAQHFSAGVDLNAFRAMIEAGDWNGIDGFLWRFQMAVKDLKYAPVPVVGAPSGLAVGGGFEVLAHCDKLVVHSNSVLGLVESAVGVVPSGGGVKESYLRWHNATGNWDDAA
ncbi:MAG TPA: 3-hydroxyacyl-CoA dehydrogenase, partial [Alphaproteobacteria bacterium]|nr:3-hydroxyacyl-CoA dehydrogenase [Alphaproteobacteria bacterium]